MLLQGQPSVPLPDGGARSRSLDLRVDSNPGSSRHQIRGAGPCVSVQVKSLGIREFFKAEHFSGFTTGLPDGIFRNQKSQFG
jgi:hypothetical protein